MGEGYLSSSPFTDQRAFVSAEANAADVGGIKNLLSGVTTVMHHNPYQYAVFNRPFPVRVIRRFGWAHSLRFSNDIAVRHRCTPGSWPFVLHAGEGTDQIARSEIFRLEEMGVLGNRTVLVHGLAIDPDGMAIIQKRRVSLVWCPSSNLFTLGRTLSGELVRSEIPIALGSDSALTSCGDLVDEIGVAQSVARLTPEQLYELVTLRAARVLRLNQGQGEIRAGGLADLVVVTDQGQTPAASLPGLHPELVIVGGRIKLVSAELAARLPPYITRGFQQIELQGRGRWMIDADVRSLYSTTAGMLGTDFWLTGRRVSL